ncbi:hypothetical protein ACT7DC_01425 [Bacillus cereus]
MGLVLVGAIIIGVIGLGAFIFAFTFVKEKRIIIVFEEMICNKYKNGI